ncbi:hypothetical protein B0H34DRAFT_703707 [Crassisporium funariophilum]|nr:hypothetical protein B0H34DRAFT_703707 [Crassisporium funariophilum]
MPRQPTRLRPAARAARNAADGAFRFNTNRKPTYLDRLLAAFYDLDLHHKTSQPRLRDNHRGKYVKMENILEHISSKAHENGETLGRRTVICIQAAIRRLVRMKYVITESRHDGSELVCLTDHLKECMEKLTMELLDWQDHDSSNIKLHRAKCDYFRKTLTPKLARDLTKRQMELVILELSREIQEQKQWKLDNLGIHSAEPRQSVVPATLQRTTTLRNLCEGSDVQFSDSMYVDDVPAASSSNSQNSPVRKSASLNNPAAYPSPQSPPRRNGSRGIVPAHSPSRSRSPVVQQGMDDADDDIMAIDSEGTSALGAIPSRLNFATVPARHPSIGAQSDISCGSPMPSGGFNTQSEDGPGNERMVIDEPSLAQQDSPPDQLMSPPFPQLSPPALPALVPGQHRPPIVQLAVQTPIFPANKYPHCYRRVAYEAAHKALQMNFDRQLKDLAAKEDDLAVRHAQLARDEEMVIDGEMIDTKNRKATWFTFVQSAVLQVLRSREDQVEKQHFANKIAMETIEAERLALAADKAAFLSEKTKFLKKMDEFRAAFS